MSKPAFDPQVGSTVYVQVKQQGGGISREPGTVEKLDPKKGYLVKYPFERPTLNGKMLSGTAEIWVKKNKLEPREGTPLAKTGEYPYNSFRPI